MDLSATNRTAVALRATGVLALDYRCGSARPLPALTCRVTRQTSSAGKSTGYIRNAEARE